MGPFKSMSRTVVKITQDYLDLLKSEPDFSLCVILLIEFPSTRRVMDNGSIENLSGALDFYQHKLESKSLGSDDEHLLYKLSLKDSARWKVYVNPADFPLDSAGSKPEKMIRFPVENPHFT
jgi:hypothetical protein